MCWCEWVYAGECGCAGVSVCADECVCVLV